LLALLVLGLVCGVLLALMPLNWMLISLVLLLLGVVGMILFHYAMWAYIGEPEEEPAPTIPPDLQGKRGPPHRNGSHRPGDPFYCK
jgi:hypothetical protein